MRLLQIKDDSFSLVERIGNDIPPYAILSHTWGKDEDEVLYQDILDGIGHTKPAWHKILFCSKQAAGEKIEYFWVDTCCINKLSSAELTEAINSMFRWYQCAKKCYVYLADVSVKSSTAWQSAFEESRWFTRGWTLQELVAPQIVEFFSAEGTRLGDKDSLEKIIQAMTGIDAHALQGYPLTHFSVKTRLSWATGRQTKREEDAAYALLGIFNVYMPMIYGEGFQNARNRLLKEIGASLSITLPSAEGASFDSYTQERYACCLPGTRSSLLHHLVGWAKDENSKPIFWLNGMAGTGKSTVARTIAHHFASQHQLGASFFFKQGEGELGSARRLFTSIAMGLMARVPEMKLGVKDVLDEDPTVIDKSLKVQFEKLVLQPLSQVLHQPRLELVIVLDALDECDEDNNIREILRLLSHIKSLKSVTLRVFVTSRPELHVRLGFKELRHGEYENIILHEIATDIVKNDILLFLQHELGNIRRQRSLPSDWPNMEQMMALADLATPLFIFAATLCRYIGDQKHNPRTRLETMLTYRNKATSKLDATYLPILHLLFEEEDKDDKEQWSAEFRTIVGSIVILLNPLSVSSLAKLLGVSKFDIGCRLDSLHSVLSVSESEFVPIRLLHLSFRDFLLDPRKKGKSPLWVDEKETHKNLASRCLEVMSGPGGLRRNICKLYGPTSLRPDLLGTGQELERHVPLHLQYACRYWTTHVVQSRCTLQDGYSVHTFLRRHLLHWLEVMSILGEIQHAVYLLKNLQALPQSNESVSSRYLIEAVRFVEKFWKVAESTPLQLYCLPIFLTPNESLISRAFAHRDPVWVKRISKLFGDQEFCAPSAHKHSALTRVLAFSSDGRSIASGSNDTRIHLWDTTTGLCRKVLKGHSKYVNAVIWLPKDLAIASASKDHTVRLWDAVTGSCSATLHGHTRSVHTLAFSQTANLLASASKDLTIRLWDLTTGCCRFTLEVLFPRVTSVTFSDDGLQVATTSTDKRVRVWSTSTGGCQTLELGHSGWITTTTFSQDKASESPSSYDGLGRLFLYNAIITGACCDPGAFGLNDHATIHGRRDLFTYDSHFGIPYNPKSRKLCLSATESWILHNSIPCLRLPAAYAPSSVAVHGDMICLGHDSGEITLLKFFPENMQWLWDGPFPT
ncbi:WD40 repeat-like protein [Ophiobolus disseminans]|uniref:WD40 repeat-like protein n=1 Tax=Ophiobolus disseminans TaxID=1469910 RepID=A0A6A6ZY90_9PLEO|nr:WD40 repeat-like protein [Ophiobolus disseminans]